ncbi:Anthocyanidin 3-O-glucosyltransferase [Acorus gramineus]|uniref:Anthocyanidin 3-O-glucosyltransferase n=1 Tax=Acorus gramineus TaxID=55184 RepID=A0AAV9A722_ACOGR|nr:Anthocyanidin 3-O-glucosyltransferase [Acorus gramineus]
MEREDLHVVMYPWFAFGHISPFVQLANALSSRGVRVSFLSAPANIPRITSLSSSSIDIIPVDIPPIDGLPPTIQSTADMTFDMAELLKIAVDDMKPQIHTLLTKLKPQIILHDFTHHWMSSVASPLGIKTLYFCVFSAHASAYVMVPSRRDTPKPSDLQVAPPDFLGDSSLVQSLDPHEAAHIFYVFKSFYGGPSVYERGVSCMRDCDAIVCKSSSEMEGPYIDCLSAQYDKPVLLTGPLVQDPPPTGELDPEWKEWLDGFAPGSVVFCSFGSETFLDGTLIEELLIGVEKTGLPFLVVLNFPKEGGDDDDDGEKKLKRAIPEGFEERVKGRGRVRTGWVPQKCILGHASVGCYVNHAGLSSVMEGLINGCQLVLLPMKGDQFLNARLCEGGMGVGVAVRRGAEDGRFDREGVCEAVMKAVAAEEGVCERWRRILSDGELQGWYVSEFIRKMRALVDVEGGV